MTVVTGWGEIDKPLERSDSRFVSCGDGESVVMRVLDMEPMTYHVHQVSSKNSQGEDVFRSIRRTDRPDDDFIDQNTNRFPAQPRHAMRVVVYDDDGDPVGIRLLEGGRQIFKQLKNIFQKYGDLSQFDVTLSREGTGINTEWTISASPSSFDIDVEEWQEEMASSEDWTHENLFPPITPQQQEQILIEAGIDITYDPVAEMMEEMTVEEAAKVRLPFGKYGADKMGGKGKTVGEIWKIDQGYIVWAAANLTNSDEVAAACRLMVESTGAIEKSGAPAKQVAPPKKSKDKPKKAKAQPPPEEPEEEDEEEDEEEGPSRSDWKGKTSPENYLARWANDPKGNKSKIDLALAILEAEGTPWGEEEPEDDDVVAGIDTEDWDEATYRDEITELLAENEDYDHPSSIVSLIEKMSKGKTKKLRELNLKQLQKMYEFLAS